MVQWHSNEWGLPSMTTVVFSFSHVRHLLRSFVREKQHGTMWHSVAGLGAALGGAARHCTALFGGGRVCVPVPPGTQRWWKVALYYACLHVPGHWQIS